MTFFIHLRNFVPSQLGEFKLVPGTHGGLTVAYKVEDGKALVAYARCSLKDNFSRRKGRLISEGRLFKGICEIVELPNAIMSRPEITRMVKNHARMYAPER